MGKNGDPLKEGVLEQRGCSFQVDKFQQLSTIQGLICNVLDVGCGLSRVRIFGVRASAFPIRGIQDLR